MERIVFLHHSTGKSIWNGKVDRYTRKLLGRSDVKSFFNRFNRKNGTEYKIKEMIFPKKSPYGWANFPYDYYNIWVKNAGPEPYMEEPTLEILTREYDIIIFKHCYPVSKIMEDSGVPDINSDKRSIENYKLQYEALKRKMHDFPDNKFIVWTPAALVQRSSSEEEGRRARDFRDWILYEWDEKGDNIFIWDFFEYETEGGLYLPVKYATNGNDSHPNKEFSGIIAPLFAQFIIDVAQGKID